MEIDGAGNKTEPEGSTTLKTSYLIFRPGSEEPEVAEVDWPREPGYHRIKALVEPLLGENEPLEHVSVLYNERPTDMFVSEMGAIALATRGPLPVNRAATEIYRAWSMKRRPGDNPETLPHIAGTAVVFQRQVWF